MTFNILMRVCVFLCIAIISLLVMAPAQAYGNGRYGLTLGDSSGPKSPPAGKRSLGGTDPCCAEDPGQQPRK